MIQTDIKRERERLSLENAKSTVTYLQGEHWLQVQ